MAPFNKRGKWDTEVSGGSAQDCYYKVASEVRFKKWVQCQGHLRTNARPSPRLGFSLRSEFVIPEQSWKYLWSNQLLRTTYLLSISHSKPMSHTSDPRRLPVTPTCLCTPTNPPDSSPTARQIHISSAFIVRFFWISFCFCKALFFSS